MTDNWFIEESYFKTYATGFKVKNILHEENSQFQNIKVLQTHGFGKLMLLDNKTMVSDLDEFVYHESTAHIPYMVHPHAKNVLIIGGGDCGIVRELVKHKDLERIDLVEIDQRVVEISKKFFPDCTSGLTDSRVKVHYKDGIEFIKNHKNTYDIVIIDSTDPEGFALGLFSADFYQSVYHALRSDGMMINQTENPFLDEFGIEKIYKNLRSTFPIVSSFQAPMIIYPGTFWTFGFASKKYRPLNIVKSKRHTMSQIQRSLKWYNMDWHIGSFALSNLHRKALGL